eukprot:jgi/Botrbrau1/20962/Bobra.0135s0080.1
MLYCLGLNLRSKAHASPVRGLVGLPCGRAPAMAHVGGPGRWICVRFPFQNAFPGSGSRAKVLQTRLEKLSQNRFNLENLLGARALDPAKSLQTHTEGLTGAWRKDLANSDPMDEACDLVELPWLFRKALLVLTKLELEDTPEHFKTVLKAGGIMDVVECYPWDGTPVKHKRRDKKKGHHLGKVVRTDKGPVIEVTWENPFGGICSDLFELSEDGHTLTQVSNMTIRDSGRSTLYKTVYRRIHT